MRRPHWLRAAAPSSEPPVDSLDRVARARRHWRPTAGCLTALARSGEGAARQLSFRASGLELDVEIQAAAAGAVILGQLAPPDAAELEVQRDDGTLIATGATDELGRLRVEVAEHGRVRLVVRRAGAAPVETSWFDI